MSCDQLEGEHVWFGVISQENGRECIPARFLEPDPLLRLWDEPSTTVERHLCVMTINKGQTPTNPAWSLLMCRRILLGDTERHE
jgi:hypothetical protein